MKQMRVMVHGDWYPDGRRFRYKVHLRRPRELIYAEHLEEIIKCSSVQAGYGPSHNRSA